MLMLVSTHRRAGGKGGILQPVGLRILDAVDFCGCVCVILLDSAPIWSALLHCNMSQMWRDDTEHDSSSVSMVTLISRLINKTVEAPADSRSRRKKSVLYCTLSMSNIIMDNKQPDAAHLAGAAASNYLKKQLVRLFFMQFNDDTVF